MRNEHGPTYQLRAQRLVAFLEEYLREQERFRQLKEHSRVGNLAGLLRRHGLLQTLLFLDTKARSEQGGDQALGQLLRAALEQVLPECDLTMAGLARLSPERYLFLNERAIEVAAYCQRLIDARSEP